MGVKLLSMTDRSEACPPREADADHRDRCATNDHGTGLDGHLRRKPRTPRDLARSCSTPLPQPERECCDSCHNDEWARRGAEYAEQPRDARRAARRASTEAGSVPREGAEVRRQDPDGREADDCVGEQ